MTHLRHQWYTGDTNSWAPQECDSTIYNAVCEFDPSKEFAPASAPTMVPRLTHPSRFPITTRPSWNPFTTQPTRHPATSRPTPKPVSPHPSRNPLASHPSRNPVASHPSRSPDTKTPDVTTAISKDYFKISTITPLLVFLKFKNYVSFQNILQNDTDY